MKKKSLKLVENIAKTVLTFHTYHHILFDIACKFSDKQITYVEIGCYAGASACLMLQRKNKRVISVDIGHPVKMNVALANVEKHNRFNNFYSYIKGDSTKKETILQVQKLTPGGIDILFIDGSHKYANVIDDFRNYGPMVNPGGFIVFDDYDDLKYSPEVRPAVNYMATCMFDNYEIVDRPKNEFIIQKKWQ